MTYLLVHADEQAALLCADPVVPAADVPAFVEARALLAAAATIRADAARDAADAVTTAHAQGLAAGRAEGMAIGATEIREELLRLAVADAARTQAQRVDLARLGLEVVRRIAADLGEPAMVAALADRAAAAIAPDPVTTVRVHPDAVSPTRDRLGARAKVDADATLAPTDCVIVTPLGEVRAGLDTQLAALARGWGIAP